MPPNPASQNVDVTFTPPNSWNFTPDPVPMSAAGKVNLHKRPANAPWNFVSATVINGGTQFTVNPPSANGDVLIVDDAHDTLGSWVYTVTVSLNGQQYTSPSEKPDQDLPPRIQNDVSGTP